MLEVFAINICANAGPKQKNVALNEYPIVVLGRRSDLENALHGLGDYVKKMFSTCPELLDSAHYKVIQCMRDNTSLEFSLRVLDYTSIT